jgi:hypothetical protein
VNVSIEIVVTRELSHAGGVALEEAGFRREIKYDERTKQRNGFPKEDGIGVLSCVARRKIVADEVCCTVR